MALSISTDLTNITTAETYTGWSDIGGGAGGAVEPDFFVQGSNCVSRAVSGSSASRGMSFDNTTGLDFTSGGTEEDMLVFMWIGNSTPALTDNVATAPGLTIRLGSTAGASSNYAEWDIVYSDLLTPPGTEFFRIYVLDPRAPPTRTSGTPNFASIREFGAVLDTNAGAKGRNLAIDRISYGFGEIICTGTADDVSSGLQELVDWDWGDVNNRWGLLEQTKAGIAAKCKIVIGDDAGTAATTFTARDTNIQWIGTSYYDGTRIRPTVGYDDTTTNNWTGLKSDGTSYYGIEIRGNAVGATNVTFGALVGTDRGRSGPTFKGSDTIPTDFVGNAGNVDSVDLFGVTFEDFRGLDFASNSSSDLMYSCSIKSSGTLDIGPIEGRNNLFIAGIGGHYTFLERFINNEASAAEQLSTADPITEWTDSLNGTDWSVPSATAGYVELLGGTTRTNLTILDDDKVGSDNHYVDCIVNFPSGGAGQGTLGPVIACHLTNDNYFWMEVDLINDQVELFRVNTGTNTSIAGPTAFTMDEDEDYQVLLRRNGTTIEGFISGNSVADGLHTTKLSATDAAHTGTAQRLVGLRGDALSGQTGATGDRPRVRLFGAGPITDNLGSIIFPTTGSLDFEDANFINCSRALSWDNSGVYSLTNLFLSGNLVDAHNDSGGLVTGNITGGNSPESTELLGISTTIFNLSVPLSLTGLTEGSRGVFIGNGGAEDGVELLAGYANNSGEISGSFSGIAPQNVIVRARNGGIINAAIQFNGATHADFTDEARNTTTSPGVGSTDDVDLLPVVITTGNLFYFGGLNQFGRTEIGITTVGSGYSGTWEYWNGAWVALTVTDNTSSFQTSGVNSVIFSKPSDWATTTINSQGPFYYIRFRVTSIGSPVQPQADFITLHETTTYLPFEGTGTIASGTGLSSVAVWIVDNNNA